MESMIEREEVRPIEQAWLIRARVSLMGCIICSQLAVLGGCANPGEDGANDSRVEPGNESEEGTSNTLPPKLGGDAAHDVPAVPVDYPEGNLDTDDRASLRVALTQPMQGESLDPDDGHFAVGVDVEASSEEESSVNEPAIDGEEVLGADRASELDAFLDDVVRHDTGGFSIGDMYFPSEDSLHTYFMATHSDDLQDKGIYAGNLLWLNGLGGRKETFSACFTPDSNSTEAQRRRVAELSSSTWEGATGIRITWFDSSGNTQVCDPNDELTADFKIYHHTEIDRGCASLGTLQSGNDGVNCGTTCCESAVPNAVCPANTTCMNHAWSSIVLPAVGPLGWLEQTAIHEIGHALGLQHEARRGDSTMSCGTADANGETANDVRVGDHDLDSVMHYCSSQEPLISVGDIATIQAALPRGVLSNDRWPLVAATRKDWPSLGNVSVDLTISHAWQMDTEVFSGDYIETIIGSSTNWGYPEAGEPYSVRATANTAGVACTAQPSISKMVRNSPQVIPPEGMQDDPIRVTCYSPAQVMTVM